MAYLTQYSSSVPVIKYHIEQTLMSIGQSFDMDICVPEDGIADNHAELEAIKNSESYQFVVKSNENEPLLELNGETTAQAELQDGDWLVIGGVEFQFTDDGVNAIVEEDVITITAPVEVTVVDPIDESIVELAAVLEAKEAAGKSSEALDLLKELKDELQDIGKPLTTKEFIANSRNSRRRLAY